MKTIIGLTLVLTLVFILACVIVQRGTLSSILEWSGGSTVIQEVVPPLSPLFDGIRFVETSNVDNPPRGDDGTTRGPYHISYAHWADSCVDGDWRDCDNATYSETVMLAYWNRYCPNALKSGDYEILARVHNGGPRGATKSSTLPYWAKVQKAMGQ